MITRGYEFYLHMLMVQNVSLGDIIISTSLELKKKSTVVSLSSYLEVIILLIFQKYNLINDNNGRTT